MKRILFIAVAILSLAACSAGRKASTMPLYDFPSLGQGGKTAIVAHRGFWQNEEAGMARNSIASLRQAVLWGFRGSECDIHLTADSVIVVNHDNSIGGRKIRTHSYEELSATLLVNGETLPTFDNYLDEFAKGANHMMLVVEFKTQGEWQRESRLVDKAFEALKAHNLFDPSKVAFISFGRDICRKVAKEAPSFVNQYLNGDAEPRVLAQEGINGMDYNGAVLKAHPSWVSEAHALGMSVNVWTVDNPDDMDFFRNLGVDQITTNDPLLARSRLGDSEFRIRKKLICLDLDATLTQHRTPLEDFNRAALDSLGRHYDLVMMCAGNAPRVWRQMGEYPIDIVANYGMQEARVKDGQLKIVRQITVPADTAFFMEKTSYLREKYGYTQYDGSPVEFHPAGMVTFGLLGTTVSAEQKVKFDPDKARRRAIYPEVLEIFRDYAVFIGGSSSFDFTPSRFNKYDASMDYAARKGYTLQEVLFIGDDFTDGGGDSHIRIKGMDYICIDDYHNFPKLTEPLLHQ